MRMIHVVFAATLAAVTALTAPLLAKNSGTQKAEDKSPSSTCSAYQQTPNGTWEQLPCKETGDRSQPQTQRSQSQGTEHEDR
ncbi:hypothetical protein [Bradyrhizobium sp. P5_C12]